MFLNRYNLGWSSLTLLTLVATWFAHQHSDIHLLESIYFYLPLCLFSLGAFFIVGRDDYDKEVYKKIIHGLGIQILGSQAFAFIWFYAMSWKAAFQQHSYAQTSVLPVSLMVVLMVFYAQHIKTIWLKNIILVLLAVSTLSVVIASAFFIPFVDLVVKLFWGLALVIMFNYSPNHEPSLHIQSPVREAPVYKRYLIGLGIYAFLLFVLPVIHYHAGEHSQVAIWFDVLAWAGFISLLTVFKVMFFGNHFAVRKPNHQFLWHFYLVGGIYLKMRKWTIYLTNYYNQPIEVMPYLYISNTLVIARHDLKDNERVINLAWEISHRQKNTHSYPLVDLVIPQREQAYEIINDMHEMIEKGNTVYVHCALGVFRTIFITGSYLTVYEKKAPQDVFNHIFCLLPDNHMKTYIKGKEPLYIKLWSEL